MEEYPIGAVTDQVSTSMPFAAFGIVPMVIILIVSLVSLVAAWRIFTKAGKPGWASIVPIYNMVVFMQIIGRPGWWILLFFIPFVNLAISIIVCLDLAKVFGKSALFGIITLWLIPVGYLILGFGSAKYVGPGAQTPAKTPESTSPATPTTPEQPAPPEVPTTV